MFIFLSTPSAILQLLKQNEFTNEEEITYQNKRKTIQGFRLAEQPDIDSGKVMLLRNRKSRFLYERKLYDYPLKMNYKTISNIGILRMVSVVKSYLNSKFILRKPKNLEELFCN